MDVIVREAYGKTTAIALGVIYSADGADKLVGTPGTSPFVEGDVKLSKDGAAATTILTAALPVFAANGYELEWTPGAGDTNIKRLSLSFEDQDGPAFLSWNIEIRTIGNVAAYYPYDGVAMRGTDASALEASLTAHEAARDAMETNLVAGHNAIELEIADITTERVNILSATGYVKNIYWASGGKYFVKESEDIDIPFGFEGNPTGLELWFVIGKDLKNIPLVKKELIEGTDWDVVDVEGVDTVVGIIPFKYADTDTLHGKYTAAAIVRTSETEAYTGWESLLVVDRPVARAEDLV